MLVILKAMTRKIYLVAGLSKFFVCSAPPPPGGGKGNPTSIDL